MIPEEEMAEEALEAEADAAHYGREHRRWLEWRSRTDAGPDKELEEARQKVVDELFEEERKGLKLAYRVDAGRLKGDVDRMFVGYYFAGFSMDIEDEIAFLNKHRGALTNAHVEASVAELEEAWPKLNYAHFRVRFAPGTTEEPESEVVDLDDDPQHPQLDLFRSGLPQDVAEWIIGQLEGANLNLLGNRQYMQGLSAQDITNEQIRGFFQKVEDTPKCQHDGTPLVFLTDDNKCLNAPHSSGFGCPECGTICCPFCYDGIRTDSVCEHFIIGSVYSEDFHGNNPFDEAAYDAARAKYLAKMKSFASGVDWSEKQKEAALGALLPFLEGSGVLEYGSDYAVSLLEALPPVSGGKKVSFYWEDNYPSVLWFKGFFCDKPEIAHGYYKEQAEKFVQGLNALAEMEPEGTTVS